MDAVSLAVPINNLPAPGIAGSSDGASTLLEENGQGPVDFATLLAAGMNLQQQLLEPVVPPSEAAVPGETAPELLAESALAATDPNALPVSPTALPIGPQVQERPVSADTSIGRNAQTDPRVTAALFARQGTEAAQTAADAARIAALAMQEAKSAEPMQPQLEMQLEFAEEMQAVADITDPRRTDAAEAATQALNLNATEQRSSIQQPVAVREVGAPVGSAGFADELSRQVVWMVDKDAQIAELRINPPDLGPVEVRLSVSGDQASAQFVATHAEVREALETSIARLRESFAQAGIQLGETSVSAESFRDQSSAQSEPRTQRGGYSDATRAGATPAPHVPAQRVHRGLVDTFA